MRATVLRQATRLHLYRYNQARATIIRRPPGVVAGRIAKVYTRKPRSPDLGRPAPPAVPRTFRVHGEITLAGENRSGWDSIPTLATSRERSTEANLKLTGRAAGKLRNGRFTGRVCLSIKMVHGLSLHGIQTPSSEPPELENKCGIGFFRRIAHPL